MIFSEPVLIILLILLLMVGFTLLSLSLSRHYSHVTDKRQRLANKTKLLLRFIGYSLLIISAIISEKVWGIALGGVYWFATTMLVATVLSIILTYKPRWLSFIPLYFPR